MSKPPKMSEDERQSLLGSLTNVGPTKPVGYLPLRTITMFLRLDVDAVAAEATARGLAAVRFDPAACRISSGALYVYDRVALAALLQFHAKTLSDSEVPTDPHAFVAHIAIVFYERGHPLWRIIAMAFADHFLLLHSPES